MKTSLKLSVYWLGKWYLSVKIPIYLLHLPSWYKNNPLKAARSS